MSAAVYVLCDEHENETGDTVIQLADIDIESDKNEVLDCILKAVKEGRGKDVYRELEKLSEDERTAILQERDTFGYSALHYAAKYNHVKIIEQLVIYGADPEIKTKSCDECTVLHLAAMYGNLETVKLLLDPKKHGTTHEARDHLKPAIAEPMDKSGQTPLHYASKKGDHEVVTILLKHRAQVDIADTDGKSPLHYASEKNHVVVATVLLQYAADVNKGDNSGKTPLHMASGEEIIVCLLDHGADVNKGNHKKQTPLHLAYREKLTVLLEHEADVHKEDSLGNTPMHSACELGYAEEVTILLKHGADVEKANEGGYNPLMVAVTAGHENVAMAFIKHDKWKSALQFNKNGNTPMKEMIRRMPDVAKKVLDRCTEISDVLDKDKEDFEVTFDYEIVEDTIARDDLDVPAKCLFCRDYCENDYDRMTHPLYLIAESENLKLLTHPLVATLLRRKWFFSAQYVHIIAVLFYFIFLGSLTVFALTVPNPQSDRCVAIYNGLSANSSNGTGQEEFGVAIYNGLSANGTEQEDYEQEDFGDAILNMTTNSSIDSGQDDCEQSEKKQQYTFATAVIVAIFGAMVVVPNVAAIGLIILENFFCRENSFDDFEGFSKSVQFLIAKSWKEWTLIFTMSLSLVFVWVFHTDCLCPYPWQWQFGVISVFLAWMLLIVIVHSIPGIGLYVTMLIDIMWTFVKTIPVTILLIIAFSFGFFMTFFEPGVLRSPFSTIIRSFLSIITYSSGGFEFDAIFRQAPGGTPDDNGLEEIPFSTVSYIIWIIFIIVMPVLLNNLLIGLAIGDISETLKRAQGKRIALEIWWSLGAENVFPKCLHKDLFIVNNETIYPNKKLSLREKIEKWLWGSDHFPTGRAIAEAVEKEDNSNDHIPLSLEKDVHEMKTTMALLSKDVREMTQLMKELRIALTGAAEK